MGKRGGTGEESSTAEPAWANGTRTRSAVFLRPGVAGASARGRFELRFSTGGPWGFGVLAVFRRLQQASREDILEGEEERRKLEAEGVFFSLPRSSLRGLG